MMTAATQVILSAYAREHIDKWVLRYPVEQKRSGVFEALRVVQEENGGSLTVPLMNAVADYLGMAHIAVYEVATFYTMYFLTPVGKHVIDLCTNISCTLSGVAEIEKHIQKRLGIGFNETTPDGNITLREVECLGACINAPVCQIGKRYVESLTIEKVDKMIDELKVNETKHGK